MDYHNKDPHFVLGTKMDTQTPRYLLPEGYTPWMENIKPKNGMLSKRYGYGRIYSLDYKALGAIKPNDELMLIATSGATKAKLLEWNLSTGTSLVLTDITGAFNFDKDAKFSFCTHYDTNIGRSICFCNGEDGLFYYPYADASPAVAQLNSGDTTFLPKFVASYNNQLFVAHTGPYMEDTTDPLYRANSFFELAWSAANYATSWTLSATTNYQYRTENDRVITGLFLAGNNLLLGAKTNSFRYFQADQDARF